MNVPDWPCTTKSRRSWLGLPSSYLASTQQPFISSFHNGYDSKSATIAMIDSAGAATSTVLLTSGIGRAYRLEERPNRVRDRNRAPALAVDVHMRPMTLRGSVFAVAEDREPICDAAIAQPRHR